jgi:hypothetical protein
MASLPSIPVELNRIFAPSWVRKTARACGAKRRTGKVSIVVFFWTLILAPQCGAATTLAALQRMLHASLGFTIAPSAFQKRFSAGLVAFLDACFVHVVGVHIEPAATPAMLRAFEDVLAIDSSLITLADSLAAVFPGPRHNNAPAAAKVNAVYSVVSGTIRRLLITAGTKAETKCLSLGREIAGSLLLFDLGYFSYEVFARVGRLGGFFISRVNKSANPRIVRDRHAGPGRTRDLVGRKLKDAVKGLGRDLLDVDVEVVFGTKRRPTKKDPRKTLHVRLTLRVIGVRHPETGVFHLYVTNVAPDVMTPDQIRAGYSGRWMVELLFAEMKGACQMRELPSDRPEVVRALILASAIRLMVSRVVLSSLRQRFIVEAHRRYHADLAHYLERRLVRRTPTRRFVQVWAEMSLLFLPEVLRVAGIDWKHTSLEMLLVGAMVDPNTHRQSLFDRLACA